MNRKVRRFAIGSVLVVALVVAGVSYVIRQVQSSRSQTSSGGSSGTKVASKVSGSSGTGTAKSFVGPTVNAYYGYVKVKAVIQNGKVKNVIVLEHPNDNGTSRYINSVAMPYLVQEAVKKQGKNMLLISGATFSSEAFVKSLSTALSKAGV